MTPFHLNPVIDFRGFCKGWVSVLPIFSVLAE